MLMPALRAYNLFSLCRFFAYGEHLRKLNHGALAFIMTTHGNDTLLRRQTDPAWLQDHYLGTGHTEDTNSATFTFIKRKGLIHAVTCGHVVDQVSNPTTVPGALRPTLALQVDRVVLNLSHVTGIRHIMPVTRAIQKEGERREIDIAIAQMPDNYWHLLTERKNKVAIDLDAW